MNRPVQWASASGRPVQWASVRGRPAQWASVTGKQVQWASARSRSPLRDPSRSRPTDRGKCPVTASSRNKTHNGAGSRGQPLKRSPSPQGAVSRSPSPQGAVSRSPSPQGASSRSPSPQCAPSRSRPADRGKCPLTSFSSNKPRNGAGSRGQPRKRSPSPQGAVSRSPSPQGATSRSPSPQGPVSRSLSPRGATSRSLFPQGASSNSGDHISPSVTIDQNSEAEDGVSATSPGADADPKALSPPEPPDGLYGVKVSNFHFRLKSKHIQLYLTKHFVPYGNVMFITVDGKDKARYALVFYKRKHEQEKALTADTTGPFGIKFSVELWSGPPPSIFGIRVTNIEDNDLYLRSRIKSEFGVFGEITKVQVTDLSHKRSALVFYKYRTGQRKALASPSPFKTSFGKVTVDAWNKPPLTFAETYVVQSHREASSSRRSLYRRGASSSRSQSPQGACRSPSPQGACSSRSPSPQGASSSRSLSPKGPSSKSLSCPKISKKRDNLISPLITSNKSIDAGGASTTATEVDVDLRELSSHEPPDRLYGVKVSNFTNQLKSIQIQSILINRFMRYGNVYCVTVHGRDRARYALVFYTQKHEQENSLTADTNGPLGVTFSVTIWSGPPPSFFGIMITNIDYYDLELRGRIASEFGIFGDIITVQIRGSAPNLFSLVFYKYQSGQEKALASLKPFDTSFGKVTVVAWNKPPLTWGEKPTYDIPYCQGASSKRSLSPQWAFSRSSKYPKISDMSNSSLSPLVSINRSNGTVVRAHTPSTGVDAQPTTHSSKTPSSLYGVKVTNFELYLKSTNVQSYLTKHFMPYGNVVCVTVHGSSRARYGLVFYKQQHERERALTAVLNSPLEMKHCITPWNGPSPCIFGIVVTEINDGGLDLPDRVRSEFSIFGDIALVMMRGFSFQRFALVFYEDQKGQEKALSAPNPFKTSFGKVSVYAWNRPPPSNREMSNEDILKSVGYSTGVVMLASQQKDSRHQQASGWNGPPVAIPHPVWHGQSLPSRMPSYIETKYKNSKSLYSYLVRSHSPRVFSRDNRSQSPLSTSARTRMRHSRSRSWSPFSYVPKHLSPRTRTRNSRSRSQSPYNRTSYSRSRSPCSYQLYPERWYTDERLLHRVDF